MTGCKAKPTPERRTDDECEWRIVANRRRSSPAVPRESAKNFCFSTPAPMIAFALDASIAAK
ncbi:hypothetical protein DF034_31375 [Burkholderia anthina]|uniref:hypothetical protein n=1 Tax=Burkholderia anthina TaxID=179879 RepID=UPI000F5DBAC7|nr:hypothetical protein [Burkholderia anthina]RQX78994.1 hypothetical protein DF034_31375 [Burkholderia anthina]